MCVRGRQALEVVREVKNGDEGKWRQRAKSMTPVRQRVVRGATWKGPGGEGEGGWSMQGGDGGGGGLQAVAWND